MIPLAYVIQPDEIVPAIGVIQSGTPHLVKRGPDKDDIIARASFVHPLYQEDDATIYYGLDEATRATSYYVYINPFQLSNND